MEEGAEKVKGAQARAAVIGSCASTAPAASSVVSVHHQSQREDPFIEEDARKI